MVLVEGLVVMVGAGLELHVVLQSGGSQNPLSLMELGWGQVGWTDIDGPWMDRAEVKWARRMRSG